METFFRIAISFRTYIRLSRHSRAPPQLWALDNRGRERAAFGRKKYHVFTSRHQSLIYHLRGIVLAGVNVYAFLHDRVGARS